MKLLLDTSILIDVLRLRNRRREWLAELVRGGHILSTTTLNIAEIYAGMRPAEEGRTEALLSGLELYELTGASARLAGMRPAEEGRTEALLSGLELYVLSGTSARLAGRLKNSWSRKGRTLALADTIVAAIAIERGCALLTDNRKDFPMPEVRLYPLA